MWEEGAGSGESCQLVSVREVDPVGSVGGGGGQPLGWAVCLMWINSVIVDTKTGTRTGDGFTWSSDVWGRRCGVLLLPSYA